MWMLILISSGKLASSDSHENHMRPTSGSASAFDSQHSILRQSRRASLCMFVSSTIYSQLFPHTDNLNSRSVTHRELSKMLSRATDLAH